ncbi:SGNH/GDSL hydrolase family protein [Cryobacterium tagatosivorans]|uniref:SGNH/GDSL hydrolase family protein n=1 Tax=Cryobacterium tagatosivorans TaxID=1259199 RepID=A0A4R8UGL6_9MICO|nr:SGNH/GDSL hydrolase family protein [Cryobacterium tagatosivorans]TFB55006.1 SGNH/GDSL hydrolase family protein [Cryobacterium tagatosivorans]
MGEFIRWALVPVMRAWAARAGAGLGHVPRPTDAPHARSAGIDSDRVLVFGSGPAVGWGVLSHDLGLPGSLARALSARTRRGVEVDAIFNPHSTARSAVADLRDHDLSRYDAIVVTLGGNDALTLTSVRAWRRDLSAFLRMLVRGSSRSTQVFMMGVQPIRAVPVFDGPLGSIAERHAQLLNQTTAVLCRSLPRTTFVPLTARPGVPSDRFRTAEDYRHWAGLLADSMVGPLGVERPGERESPA